MRDIRPVHPQREHHGTERSSTVTSPFARTTPAAPAAASPFGQQTVAPAPAPATFSAPPVEATTTPTGSRFATKRERPDNFPTAADLMPSEAKGFDGALVVIRVTSVQRGLKSQTGGTYDAFDTQTWILDAPRGLPAHVLEAGEERDGAFHLREMRWSGAGLVRDLETPLAERQLFVGRVSAYKNQFNRLSPEFAMATDAELAKAEAYVNAHPEVDYPKTTFARAS
jgi:hypothetical protein